MTYRELLIRTIEESTVGYYGGLPGYGPYQEDVDLFLGDAKTIGDIAPDAWEHLYGTAGVLRGDDEGFNYCMILYSILRVLKGDISDSHYSIVFDTDGGIICILKPLYLSLSDWERHFIVAATLYMLTEPIFERDPETAAGIKEIVRRLEPIHEGKHMNPARVHHELQKDPERLESLRRFARGIRDPE
jgi:hypothetical protein